MLQGTDMVAEAREDLEHDAQEAAPEPCITPEQVPLSPQANAVQNEIKPISH